MQKQENSLSLKNSLSRYYYSVSFLCLFDMTINIKNGNYILLDPKCEKVVLKPWLFENLYVYLHCKKKNTAQV